MKNIKILLSLFLLNLICFTIYFVNNDYNITGDSDPNIILILNPLKEVTLHVWKWTELWNLGGNTDWQTGRIVMGIFYHVLQLLVGIKSRILFEVIFITFAGFGMYLFSKEYIFKDNWKYAFLSAVIYMYNPYVGTYLERNVLLLLSYLVFPYFTKLSIDIIKSSRITIKYILISVLLFNIVTINFNPGTFGIMVISLLIVILFYKGIKIYDLKNLFVVHLFGFLSASWNVVPIISYETIYKSEMLNFLTLERFQSLGTSMTSAFTLTNFWEFKSAPFGIKFFPLSEVYKEYLLLILPIIAISSLIINKSKDKKILGLNLLLALGIFLAFSDAPTSPLKGFFTWLETHTIYSIFRNNFKFCHMILIAYSLLIPYTLQQLYKFNRKICRVSSLLLTIIVIVLLVSPFAIGKLHKDTFQGLPNDMNVVSKSINKDDTNQRVIIIPGQHLQYYNFQRIYMNRPLLFATIDKPVIFQDTAIYPYDMFVRDSIQYIYEKLLKYNLRNLFELLNVRYIIVDKTLDLRFKKNLNPVELRENKNCKILENYLFMQEFKQLYSSENYSIFKFEHENKPILEIVEPAYTTENPISPKYINNLPINRIGLTNDFDMIANVGLMFLNSEPSPILSQKINDTVKIKFDVFDETKNSGWVLVTSNKRPPMISEYEYGFGAIATRRSNDTIRSVFTVVDSARYLLFVNIFLNQRGGEIKVYLDGKPITIKTKEFQPNKFVWKYLGTFYLKKGKHEIVLENVEGFNVVSLFVLIPEKEYYKAEKEVKKLLQNKTIIYLFEAESNLYPSNAEVIKDLNFSNGEALALLGKAWQDVEIVKSGTYILILKGEGRFRVKINGNEFELESNSNFVSTPMFFLSSGKYRLEITSIVKNLVRNPSFEKVFDGLLEDWSPGNTKDFKISFDRGYDDKYSLKASTSTTKEKMWSNIRSKPIDVDSGRYYFIITHIKYYNVKGSHIKIDAYYPKEKKWKFLKPFIPGGRSGTSDWQEYSAIIKIPENATKIRVVLNAGWVLNKSRGEAITWFDDIWVIPLEEAPKLDVIWLYSTETNQTIDQLFEVKEKPAKVLNYTKINPTLWKVKVNATKPFMLSFAEAYDPLWEARIYKDGRLVEKVRSIPLYSVINGFWIDKTGELEIVIRYTPQDWFEIGLIISAITFVSCIGYLFYDWRREKGDKWAKEIERRLNEIQRRWKNKV